MSILGSCDPRSFDESVIFDMPEHVRESEKRIMNRLYNCITVVAAVRYEPILLKRLV